MSESLTFDEHGDGIGDAWTVLREHANRAGLSAPVPTCPEWTVRDLVVHVGVVHRWAVATLRGEQVESGPLDAEGRAAVDLLDWLDVGAKDLLQTLVDAPDDLAAFFFLKNAAAPKFAWARRQCHETTIHAVDAMSASLGRPPVAAETWIRGRLASDGVDELLTGFVPRRHERVRSAAPHTIRVEALDTGATWTMAVSDQPVVTARGAVGDPNTVWSGTAAQLYLGLWNRGEEIVESGAPFLPQWRDQMAVRFS